MRRSILLIDDDEQTAATLTPAFRAEGFDVTVATSAQSGLRCFQATPSDVVLLELALPDMSGLDVCGSIRTSSDVPIIMLSWRDADLDKVVSLEIGADDYVTKPVSFRELLARVRARIRRAEIARSQSRQSSRERPAETGVVRLGRAWVDAHGHRLFRDGVAVAAPPRAFQLLLFLLRHAGQVFSREQLIERVWGYDTIADTRTVSVHVSWLRMQIEDDPSDPTYLQTVRGIGYVLRPESAMPRRSRSPRPHRPDGEIVVLDLAADATSDAVAEAVTAG